MRCNAIVVDTETAAQRLGQCEELAKIFGARLPVTGGACAE